MGAEAAASTDSPICVAIGGGGNGGSLFLGGRTAATGGAGTGLEGGCESASGRFVDSSLELYWLSPMPRPLRRRYASLHSAEADRDATEESDAPHSESHEMIRMLQGDGEGHDQNEHTSNDPGQVSACDSVAKMPKGAVTSPVEKIEAPVLVRHLALVPVVVVQHR